MGFFDRVNDLSRYNTTKVPDDNGKKVELEKGDLLALIVSALIVFLPILLVLGLITLVVMKFFRAI